MIENKLAYVLIHNYVIIKFYVPSGGQCKPNDVTHTRHITTNLQTLLAY